MEMLKWEFDCNKCKQKFVVPVPRGPAEERLIKCPHCGSKDITNCSLRVGLEAPVCGG